jgi:SAM-dependent methyltransferase
MASNIYTDGTYLDNVGDWHTGDAPWKSDQVAALLERNHLDPRSVHDVGCGAGEVLARLQPRLRADAELLGMDIATDAIALAGQRTNDRLAFEQGDYLAADVGRPDVLLLLDVFEHVPDYLGFLTELRDRADLFVFHIPLDLCAWAVTLRSRWMLHMRETYGHLHYFSYETALATLEDAGYTIVDECFTDDYDADPAMVPTGAASKQRVYYEARRRLFRRRPRLAAAVFPHFNVLVLARGARTAQESPGDSRNSD